MNRLSTPEPTTAATRRFSLWSLFELQLVVSPLFLAPLYMRSHQSAHPYAYAVSLLLAPILYVVVLEVLFSKADRGKWPVFAAIRRGCGWGVLFGLLSMVPAQIWESLGRFTQWRNEFAFLGNIQYQAFRSQVWAQPGNYLAHVAALFLGLPALILFILLHYALIGAAVGGIVALVRGRRRRFETHAARVTA